MDVAYVEMVEDLASASHSTSHVRDILDRALADIGAAPVVLRGAAREAWLTGTDAAAGQAAMLDFAAAQKRRAR